MNFLEKKMNNMDPTKKTGSEITSDREFSIRHNHFIEL